MPLNLPTIDREKISFGPGRLFIGAAGSTPSTDLGAINEGGITVEIASEPKYIMQGNPKTKELAFYQSQDVMVKATSIQWDMDNLANGLGAGVTASGGTYESWSFGGEPCPNEVAIHIEHQMCRSGHTMNVYVWRAVGEGNVTLPFTHDEHEFEYSWAALRAEEDWNSVSLASSQQLIQVLKQTA